MTIQELHDDRVIHLKCNMGNYSVNNGVVTVHDFSLSLEEDRLTKKQFMMYKTGDLAHFCRMMKESEELPLNSLLTKSFPQMNLYKALLEGYFQSRRYSSLAEEIYRERKPRLVQQKMLRVLSI